MMTRVKKALAGETLLGALTQNFFRRFFDNEITGGTRDLTSMFFWMVGFVGGPFALVPIPAMVTFRLIAQRLGPEALRVLSRPTKLRVIELGMAVSAFLAAVVWRSLMLDRRDGLILGALPLRARSVVGSKLAALAMYVMGVAAAMHTIPSVLFGLILSDRTHSVRLAALGPFAHFAATTSACAFVFLSITAVQGIALSLVGPRAFRRLSSFLQMAVVGGVIIGLTKFTTVLQAAAQLDAHGASHAPAPWLFWLPPLWFLGLYEWILGGAEAAYVRLALIAVVALATTSIITVATYAVVYRRLVAQVVETPEDAGSSGWLGALLRQVVRVLSRRPPSRAASQFFFASVGRVERPRFVVAVTLGIVCAWIAPALLLLAPANRSPSLWTMFSLSYVAMALVIVGLRISISMPSDLRASWLLAAIGAPRRWLRSGLWRAFYLSAVVPVALGFTILGVSRWTWPVAVGHASVMLSAGVFLIELALWHFDDMSNARPWRPEGANLRMSWPAYVAGFTALTAGLPTLEQEIGGGAAGIIGLCGVFLLAAWALRIVHGRPYPAPSFEIETVVEAPSVLGLD